MSMISRRHRVGLAAPARSSGSRQGCKPSQAKRRASVLYSWSDPGDSGPLWFAVDDLRRTLMPCTAPTASVQDATGERRRSRSAFPLCFARHRHEPHRCDELAVEAFLGPRDPHKILVRASNRRHEVATNLELIQQGARDTRWRRGGKHDRIERSALGPALVPVADSRVHRAITQLPKQTRGGSAQLGNHLDRIHLADTFRQYGRLIARACADLQDPHLLPGLDELGHQCHDIGLRDRLSLTNRQRIISICQITQMRGNKPMPGHLAHRAEDGLAANSPFPKLPLNHLAPAGLMIGSLHDRLKLRGHRRSWMTCDAELPEKTMKEQKTQGLEVCHDAVPPICQIEGNDHDRQSSLQVDQSRSRVRPVTHGTTQSAKAFQPHSNNNGISLERVMNFSPVASVE